MKWLHVMRLALMSTALACFCVSCDDNDDLSGSEFYINPAAATLTQTDNAVSLTAVGGDEPLTWSVSDSSLGQVSGSGRTVTYTRTTANGVNTVLVEDSRTWQATASIVQQDDAEAIQDLTISPTSATLNIDGAQTVFTGSGGVGPYAWSLGNNAVGRLRVDGWSQAVYTRTAAGDNTVLVTDSQGHSASAAVSQPDNTPALTVSANPSSLSANGNTSVLTASGGVAPYQWQVLDVALGHLVSSSGSSVVYVRDQAGQNAVSVSDSAGNVAHVIINQP